MFFIEENNLNVFDWPRIFRQKMYFLNNSSFTIINKESSLTVVKKRKTFSRNDKLSILKDENLFENDRF